MPIKNNPAAYGLISKSIHWITALLIFGLLSIGFIMVDLPFSEDKFKIYALHKSFGLLVLLLVFARVAWHLLSKKPKSLDTHQKWEKLLAHGVHYFLYFALFMMPISGWVMSSAGDFNVGFFGIPMPDLVGRNEGIFENAKEVHETLAIILIIMIGLHMAGAFKHHFIDRDLTLVRMTREGLGFMGGAVLVVLAGLAMLPPVYFVAMGLFENEDQAEGIEVENVQNQVENLVPNEEGAWSIVKDQSKIGFEATQYGQIFEGKFENFDGTIIFDPQNLAASKVDITIVIASIKTGASDRDGQAVGAEWFDIKTYPQAKFVSQSFENIAPDQYKVKGNLTLRGVSLPLEFPFDLKIIENSGQKKATMRAELSLNRLDFGIGQGQWQSTDAIGNAVRVKIAIEAMQ